MIALHKGRTMQSTLQDNTVVLTLSGRIDLSSRQHLRTLVKDGLAQGATHVLLDLHEVSFIDSAGFGALIACCGLVQKHGGRLALTRIPKRVSDLMEITRLAHVFEIETPVESGLASNTQ
jgi:anti-sigma B factor antagonist